MAALTLYIIAASTHLSLSLRTHLTTVAHVVSVTRWARGGSDALFGTFAVAPQGTLCMQRHENEDGNRGNEVMHVVKVWMSEAESNWYH